MPCFEPTTQRRVRCPGLHGALLRFVWPCGLSRVTGRSFLEMLFFNAAGTTNTISFISIETNISNPEQITPRLSMTLPTRGDWENMPHCWTDPVTMKHSKCTLKQISQPVHEEWVNVYVKYIQRWDLPSRVWPHHSPQENTKLSGEWGVDCLS